MECFRYKYQQMQSPVERNEFNMSEKNTKIANVAMVIVLWTTSESEVTGDKIIM